MVDPPSSAAEEDVMPTESTWFRQRVAALERLAVLAGFARLGGAPQLLSATEAAELLSCGRSTIYRLMRDGELGHVVVGQERGKKVPVADLVAYVQARYRPAWRGVTTRLTPVGESLYAAQQRHRGGGGSGFPADSGSNERSSS